MPNKFPWRVVYQLIPGALVTDVHFPEERNCSLVIARLLRRDSTGETARARRGEATR